MGISKIDASIACNSSMSNFLKCQSCSSEMFYKLEPSYGATVLGYVCCKCGVLHTVSKVHGNVIDQSWKAERQEETEETKETENPSKAWWSPTMSSAYKVKYLSPKGVECPTAVVTFDAPSFEIDSDLISVIQDVLVKARGGYWNNIKIMSVEYLGPWFNGQG